MAQLHWRCHWLREQSFSGMLSAPARPNRCLAAQKVSSLSESNNTSTSVTRHRARKPQRHMSACSACVESSIAYWHTGPVVFSTHGQSRSMVSCKTASVVPQMQPLFSCSFHSLRRFSKPRSPHSGQTFLKRKSFSSLLSHNSCCAPQISQANMR